MKKYPKQPFLAFTIKYGALVNRITTDVSLSEAFDPKVVDPSNAKLFQTSALWDTGATRSIVTKDTADKIGLIPVGSVNVNHAGGSSVAKTYLVNIFLPNKVAIIGALVTECPAADFGAIIGMDIIARGDFCITNYDKKTWMTFRIPSHRTADYVVEAQKIAYAGIKPYQPCPCGSKDANGKPISFARCHGKKL